REARGAVKDQQRQVLVLPVVAVVARQRLPAVGRVVGGVHVEGDLGRRRDASAQEQVEQEVIEPLDPLQLRGAANQQDVRFALLLAATRVGVWEARQGAPTGQRLFAVGGDLGQDLEQGVLAQGIGVVAVGVAGQNLVDL